MYNEIILANDNFFLVNSFTFKKRHFHKKINVHLAFDYPITFKNLIKFFFFRYNATLGHKVNHSFEPSSEFVLFAVHPILGTIMSLVALQDIPANQEVNINFIIGRIVKKWDRFKERFLNVMVNTSPTFT